MLRGSFLRDHILTSVTEHWPPLSLQMKKAEAQRWALTCPRLPSWPEGRTGAGNTVMVMMMIKAVRLSRVRHFCDPMSMRFFRQEYRSGLPFPSPRDLPGPGIKPTSAALQVDSSVKVGVGRSSTLFIKGSLLITLSFKDGYLM